jgi:hypothetical protein
VLVGNGLSSFSLIHRILIGFCFFFFFFSLFFFLAISKHGLGGRQLDGAFSN